MPASATQPATATAEHAPGEEELAARYQTTYPGWANQVGNVRRDVAKHLAECPVIDNALLVASELATNSILHSRSRGGHFTIRLELYRHSLRVECHDAGGPWRARQEADNDRPHGLSIVEALAGPDGWGTKTTGDSGRVVWATLTW
jgi:two-component sensor histidine kinase